MRRMLLAALLASACARPAAPGSVHGQTDARRVRSISTAQQKVFQSGHLNTPFRLLIRDADGVLQDLRNLYGRDWIKSATITEHVDQPVMTLEVVLQREAFDDSLSPFRTDTRPNLTTGSFAPLTFPGAEVIAQVAFLAQGDKPGDTDWMEVFRGLIDVGDLPADLTLRARGPGGRLQDLWIQRDREYGSDVGVPMEDVIQAIVDDNFAEEFEASGTYSDGDAEVHGDRVRPTTPNGLWYRVTVGGTAGSEPTWPTTLGDTVTSGGVTFACAGVLPQLYTPSSPSFDISPKYNQQPMSVLEAGRALAFNLIGWDLRYRWRTATNQFELTLRDPDREREDVDFIFDRDHFYGVRALSVDRRFVRNSLDVTFSDRSDLDEAGQPKRKTVHREDRDSMDKYSEGLPLWMQISEASTSPISSQSEAETLAENALSDLKDPVAVSEYELPLFPWAQLGDRYGFSADGRIYSDDQEWAVTSIRHVFGPKSPRTFVGVRGKPVAGVKQWLRLAAGDVAPSLFQGPDAPTDIVVTQVQGGVAVRYSTPPRWAITELHLSDTDSFTPDENTFAGRSATNLITVTNLTYGQTYYGQLVARDRLGNRSEPSEEFEFIAGYTAPRAMSPRVMYNDAPFNSSFEAQSDPNAPPDSWEVTAGTWGTHFTLVGADVNGANSVQVTGTSKTMKSDFVPATNFSMIQMEVGLKVGSGGVARIWIEEYDSGFGLIQTGTAVTPSGADAKYGLTGSKAFAFIETALSSGTSYVRFCVGTDSTNSGTVKYEYVRGINAGMKWYVIGSSDPLFVSLGNSWVQFGSSLDAAFRRDAQGYVHLRGLIKNGTINAVAFTLPVGYRPGQAIVRSGFSRNSGGTPVLTRIDIGADGTVKPSVGDNSLFSFDGVSFLAEQ